ncbi:MAG: hydrogenase nickel incorporation protein HypA [Sulfolobales archaeon]|nr:hydrogenase nickel incorporation protein HypA [Sulfolobales archaeon]MCX8199525.1 hydrogenase nickel incorporation protein HypA [Sulfolobales archaeon]MDW8170478.1 hydrogenase nickel incorporation protein HypA [Desulfurococcaceae archaeon]
MVHEWALAEAIATYVTRVSKGRSVKRLVLSIGKLQSVNAEIFDFALRELLSEGNVVVSELKYLSEEILLKCRKCYFEWSPSIESLGSEVSEFIHFIPEVIHSYVSCPKCSSRDYDILSGRGIRVVEVVLGEGGNNGS